MGLNDFEKGSNIFWYWGRILALFKNPLLSTKWNKYFLYYVDFWQKIELNLTHKSRNSITVLTLINNLLLDICLGPNATFSSDFRVQCSIFDTRVAINTTIYLSIPRNPVFFQDFFFQLVPVGCYIRIFSSDQTCQLYMLSE